MSKWRVIRSINPTKYDAIIDAACRYINSTTYPCFDVLAAIIGLEEIPDTDLPIDQSTEMEDGE